ncbi:MAG: M20/M25/M40 family metallo-hydrolase [Bacteroidales bacterium]|nr:M20/M25/M40 family metallo-hydrolase [Bacteroidales bacterium]
MKNDSVINVLLAEVNADSVESYIQSLQDMQTRFMISPNRLAVAQWIREKFISFGMEPEYVQIDSVICTTNINLWNLHYDTTTWQYNVITTIPGIENTNTYYVMGAHYDDVVAPSGNPMEFAPGADDNASGVAALLEAARVIADINYHPKTSIELVAFGAEELMNYGNSGSEGYVAHAIANEKDIHLMLNNDMIANNNGPLWRIDVSNYYGCEWYTNMAQYIALTYTEIEPLLDNPSASATGDCKYFYEADIPCVYFMEHDFNPYYHSVNDLIDHCEVDYCAEAIKISLGVLVAADDPIVGWDEDELNEDISVYPNPSPGSVNIVMDASINGENPVHFVISGYDGKEIKSGTLDCNEKRALDLGHIPDGLYFIRFIGKEKISVTRLVIRR